MGLLQFLFQSCVVEAAVRPFWYLEFFFAGPQLPNYLGAAGPPHCMFSPPVHLKILPNMRIVDVENGYAGASGRVDKLPCPGNHGNSPVALDLPVDKIVEHVNNQYRVATVFVVDVG